MRFTYAQALNVSRRFDEAEKQLRAAVQEAPEYAEAWQLLGLTLEEAGRGKEALAVYNKLLNADPGNRSARLFLLRFHLRGNDMRSALDVVKSASDPLQFAVAASSLLVEEKRFSEAEALFIELEAVPGFPEGVYFYHAALFYEAGSSLETAVHFLDKVPDSSDEYDKALRLKVRLLCDLERFPQALEAVEIVHRLNPEDDEPMLLMGELCSRLKRYEEAEAIFAKALREHPDNEHLHFRNAYLRELQGRRDQAMALMEKVVLQFPDHALALNYVGYNLADSGIELERALALIQRAAELEPEADFIIDSLAWAHFRLGNIEEAWTQIQRHCGCPDITGDDTHYFFLISSRIKL
jgi:tetratricopeptide (TPR) repeat protein